MSLSTGCPSGRGSEKRLLRSCLSRFFPRDFSIQRLLRRQSLRTPLQKDTLWTGTLFSVLARQLRWGSPVLAAIPTPGSFARGKDLTHTFSQTFRAPPLGCPNRNAGTSRQQVCFQGHTELFFRGFEKGLADRGGWRKDSFLCQRFRHLFCILFPIPPLVEGGHNSGEFLLHLGPVSRQLPPANPFSKPLIFGPPPLHTEDPTRRYLDPNVWVCASFLLPDLSGAKWGK